MKEKDVKIKIDRNSKTFFLLFFVCIIVSIFSVFYKMVILSDYEVFYNKEDIVSDIDELRSGNVKIEELNDQQWTDVVKDLISLRDNERRKAIINNTKSVSRRTDSRGGGSGSGC